MSQAALLVIDVQNIYAMPESPLCVPEFSESLARVNRLIARFAATGAPVIYVRHVHRADGRDAGRMFDFSGAAEPMAFIETSPEAAYVPNLLQIPAGLHITKHRYSCFEGTELEAILRSLDIRRIAICGYMTNFCCETTARAAHDKDYFVDFIADATGAPDLAETYRQPAIIQAVSATLAAGFARIFTTEAYLEAMQ